MDVEASAYALYQAFDVRQRLKGLRAEPFGTEANGEANPYRVIATRFWEHPDRDTLTAETLADYIHAKEGDTDMNWLEWRQIYTESTKDNWHFTLKVLHEQRLEHMQTSPQGVDTEA